MMQTPDHIQIESILAASDAGGAYLEKTGLTDLTTMNNRQWMTFIETIIREFETTRNRLTVDPPF